MEMVATEEDAISAMSGTSTVPFAQVYVTLTKLEHIELVMQARSWKSLHQRAVGRLQQFQDSTKRFVAQLREHAAAEILAAQFATEHGFVKGLRTVHVGDGDLEPADGVVQLKLSHCCGRSLDGAWGLLTTCCQ